MLTWDSLSVDQALIASHEHSQIEAVLQQG